MFQSRLIQIPKSLYHLSLLEVEEVKGQLKQLNLSILMEVWLMKEMDTVLIALVMEQVNLHARTHTHTHTRTDTQTDRHTYICTHATINTHTHTHTHTDTERVLNLLSTFRCWWRLVWSNRPTSRRSVSALWRHWWRPLLSGSATHGMANKRWIWWRRRWM